MRHILQPLLRHPYADLRAMEAMLRASPLDWTIVRPPRLTSGPRTDRLRFAIDAPLVGATHIARADLAGFMVTNLDDPAIVRTTGELFRLLVRERGWSPDDYERWLADTLASALLAPAAPPRPRARRAP